MCQIKYSIYLNRYIPNVLGSLLHSYNCIYCGFKSLYLSLLQRSSMCISFQFILINYIKENLLYYMYLKIHNKVSEIVLYNVEILCWICLWIFFLKNLFSGFLIRIPWTSSYWYNDELNHVVWWGASPRVIERLFS